MLRLTIFCILAVVALAAEFEFEHSASAHEHNRQRRYGYSSNYNHAHDLIIMTLDGRLDSCYIIDAPHAVWDRIMLDHNSRMANLEAIQQQILADQGLTTLTQEQAAAYHSALLEAYYCRDREVVKVDYTPTTA